MIAQAARAFQIAHIVSYAPLAPSDKQAIADFHRAARVASDSGIMPAYTKAGVAGGYYEALWNRHFTEVQQGCAAETVKATLDGQIIGFARFSGIEPPAEAALQTHGAQGWSELHQLYLDPSVQRQGIGYKLFRMAEERLARAGFDKMLVNVLKGNKRGHDFYRQAGCHPVMEVVEHNERNGIVFEVPCVLYVKPLASKPEPA